MIRVLAYRFSLGDGASERMLSEYVARARSQGVSDDQILKVIKSAERQAMKELRQRRQHKPTTAPRNQDGHRLRMRMIP